MTGVKQEPVKHQFQATASKRPPRIMRNFYPLPSTDMRWVLYPFIALLGLIAIGVAVLPSPWRSRGHLPSLEALTDYHPKIPCGFIPRMAN